MVSSCLGGGTTRPRGEPESAQALRGAYDAREEARCNRRRAGGRIGLEPSGGVPVREGATGLRRRLPRPRAIGPRVALPGAAEIIRAGGRTRDMSGPIGRPEYTIAAVSKLTGVSCHTLRVWERRYGFPEPHRSASGH